MIPSFNLCIDEGTFNEALEILKCIRPSWDESRLILKVFTDGITNKLFGYYVSEDPEDIVLFRLYGRNTEMLIDRKAELTTMKVFSSIGCAAPVYATFSNGICYGFCPGQTLDEKSVRDEKIQRLVAEAFVKIHMVRLNGDADEVQPLLFPLLKKFMCLVPSNYDEAEKNKRFHEAVPNKDFLWRELQILEQHLSSLGSPVVFCHNDALLKNIIYDECKDQVTFIDYEYAGYNYQAFDIANHFCEFSGINSTNLSLYPSKEFQLNWLRTYLEIWHRRKIISYDVTDKDIERLYVQVNKFALASNFLWCVWGLIQAAHSTIEFDFLSFALTRLNEYFLRKTEFLNLELPA